MNHTVYKQLQNRSGVSLAAGRAGFDADDSDVMWSHAPANATFHLHRATAEELARTRGSALANTHFLKQSKLRVDSCVCCAAIQQPKHIGTPGEGSGIDLRAIRKPHTQQKRRRADTTTAR